MRVHELAKKYGKSNKEFMEILKGMGIEVSSHLSGLPEGSLKKVTDKFEKKIVKNVTNKTEAKKDDKKEMKKDEKKDNNEKVIKTKKINEKKDVKSEEKKEERKPSTKFTQDSKKKKKKRDYKNKNKNASKFPENDFNDGTELTNDGEITVVQIPEELPLKDFAEKIRVNGTELVKKLFLKGQMITINSMITYELAEELALEFDILIEKEEVIEESYGDKFNLEIEDKDSELQERPPVITIMGHVDHGKTSLLDAIRKSNVADGEAGGITQKIGAYQIEKEGKKITFIDTPGHEAFTDMRSRGTKITDIAILVVAADDGVMPQTIEAISHAKEAEVPIIVAVNKIDKPGADVNRVRQELTEYNLLSADWGGDTDFVEVSAKQRINLDELLETILITSELLELKANPAKRGKGVVLESRLDPNLGPVADILIQEGNIKVGDVFVAGESFGKVRAMIDHKGNKISKATLAQPAEIMGFNTVPEAGDILYVIQNEKQGKKIIEEVVKAKKIKEQNQRKHISLEDLSKQLETNKLKELKLIIKSDSKGSVEALKDALAKLSNEEVIVKIIQASPGAVTEGDVKLAEASDAIIIGFNVRPTNNARREAERENVEIRTYKVIYHITEDIEKAIHGMLDPEFKEVYMGRAEVQKVFKITNLGNIAGSLVIDGKITRSSQVRVLRNGIIVYEGELSSLKRFTNDASEVIGSQECGIGIDKFNDMKAGDVIEAFIIEEIKR